MTKVAFITDTHYGIRNDNHNFYDYQKKFNDYFFATLEDEGIDTIIHGGDLVDRRKYINFLTATRLKDDFLKRLNDYDCYLICGNHDVYYRDTNSVSSLDTLLGGYSNIKVYKEPTEVVIKGHDVLFLPWITADNQERSLKAIKSSRSKTVFGHLEIQGFEYLKGVECHEGLSRETFENFNRVYTGHFHLPSDNDRVFYTGAAYQFDWSDSIGHRGFCIINLEDGEIDRRTNPFTLFRTYTYDDIDNKEIIEKDLEQGYFKKMKDNYVRLYITEKQTPALLSKVIEAIEEAMPIDLKIIDNTVFDGVKIAIDDTKVDDTPTTIRRYIDSMNLDNDTEKGIHRLMEELYHEAVSMESTG